MKRTLALTLCVLLACSTLACGAPPIVLSILVLWLIRWRMNLLPLSEEEAVSSGVNIRILRAVTVCVEADRRCNDLSAVRFHPCDRGRPREPYHAREAGRRGARL